MITEKSESYEGNFKILFINESRPAIANDDDIEINSIEGLARESSGKAGSFLGTFRVFLHISINSPLILRTSLELYPNLEKLSKWMALIKKQDCHFRPNSIIEFSSIYVWRIG